MLRKMKWMLMIFRMIRSRGRKMILLRMIMLRRRKMMMLRMMMLRRSGHVVWGKRIKPRLFWEGFHVLAQEYRTGGLQWRRHLGAASHKDGSSLFSRVVIFLNVTGDVCLPSLTLFHHFGAWQLYGILFMCADRSTSGPLKFDESWYASSQYQIVHEAGAPWCPILHLFFGIGKRLLFFDSACISCVRRGWILEFYRGFNVSWTQPAKYFEGHSSIDKDRLKPCVDTRLMVSQAPWKDSTWAGGFGGQLFCWLYAGRKPGMNGIVDTKLMTQKWVLTCHRQWRCMQTSRVIGTEWKSWRMRTATVWWGANVGMSTSGIRLHAATLVIGIGVPSCRLARRYHRHP